MGALLIRKNFRCCSCGNALGSQLGLSTIDVPFVSCSKCKTFNILAPSVTEWQLMSRVRQVGHILGTFVWGLILGCVFLAVFMFVAIKISPSFAHEKMGSSATLMFYLLGCIPGLGISSRTLLKAIKASNKRLSDPEYQVLLRKYGISARDR